MGERMTLAAINHGIKHAEVRFSSGERAGSGAGFMPEVCLYLEGYEEGIDADVLFPVKVMLTDLCDRWPGASKYDEFVWQELDAWARLLETTAAKFRKKALCGRAGQTLDK